MMVGALTDPFDTIHMGVTAENVATKCGITREQQDAFAVESHRRAAAAQPRAISSRRSCRSSSRARRAPTQFDTDEHVRADATRRRHGQAEGGVRKENGTVTAGNASGINDAAAAVVLMEKQRRSGEGLKPMARLVAYGHAGIDPKIMGLGPVARGQGARSRRPDSSSATWTSSNRTRRSRRRRSA